MLDLKKIKLIIWDLDDTFWQGTLSEGDVTIPPKHRDFIQQLTDLGIVNAICSKNDWHEVEEVLKREGLREYFVFNSVNWEAKGQRVQQIINDMQLRAVNVLFIDDNHLNVEEVKYYCPEIMTADPEEIDELIHEVNQLPKKDLEHKRLHQYQLLEEKRSVKNTYSSNEDFLRESAIQVTIQRDCLNHVERIHDLLLRANQLNFTKVRSSMDELISLLSNPEIESGYVAVHDKFGDYGIIGFYAIKEDKLLHFAFSCRTLGMGIEQYVYNILKRPKLTINGEVISDLSSTEIPDWINQKEADGHHEQMSISGLSKHQVLIKGPCDLFQIYPYIANTELFDTDFTHTTDSGLTVESTGHTTHIVESLRLSSAQKELVVSEVPFADMSMYDDRIFKLPYRVVVISILTDANLGVYARKGTGEKLAFLEYIHPITDPSSWKGLIEGTYHHGGFTFTREILEDFSSKYEYLGRNTPDQVLKNIQYIRNHLDDDCLLVLMLGGELEYIGHQFGAYQDRHIVHKEMNDVIRAYAQTQPNVRLLDVNKYLVDQSSFYDHFNHYVKPVYYALASDLVALVNEKLGTNIKETSKAKMLQIRLKEVLAPTYYKIRKIIRKKR